MADQTEHHLEEALAARPGESSTGAGDSCNRKEWGERMGALDDEEGAGVVNTASLSKIPDVLLGHREREFLKYDYSKGRQKQRPTISENWIRDE